MDWRSSIRALSQRRQGQGTVQITLAPGRKNLLQLLELANAYPHFSPPPARLPGDVGWTISKHFAAIGGYQLGSHLVVNGTHDRLGLLLVQKGAIRDTDLLLTTVG
jgi:hypothetical protein